MTTDTTQSTQTDATATAASNASLLDSWKGRFEELLKAKNIDDVKSELGKLAQDLQKEIQSFDLNAHLSPAAKDRVRTLEKSYNEVLRSLHRVQKEFDREFNKTIRLVKKTRTDAEKRLSTFKKQFGQQKAKLGKVVKSKTAKKKTKTKKAKKS